MAEYRASGSKISASSHLRFSDGPAPVEQAVQIDPSARSDAERARVRTEDDALVEVELENGVVFWTRLDQLRQDTASLARRGAEEDLLPTHFPSGAATDRGLFDIAIKTLKFLGYDPIGDLGEDLATLAAGKVESQLAGSPGLYHIDEAGGLSPSGIERGTAPVLLFIHGTASSTTGGFGGLTQGAGQRPRWDELWHHYQGRVFGFEHRTLSEFPAQNAVELLSALPSDGLPPLHIVSHSRGGLVGDLIGHGGVSGTVFPKRLVEGYGIHESQHEVFDRLNELLVEKAPRVERFLRVGCPAGGTTLASGRLDMFLSLLFQLMSKTPAVGPLLGGVGELVAAVAKQRTDPEVLPGLEAQMPKSPFVRLLNSSGHVLDSDLTVIAGDSDGFVKNLANLFYWGANDLVVDTRSMYRGAVRRERRWYRAEGDEVHHCNYFERDETVKQLVAGLTRSEGSDAGFERVEPRSIARGSVPSGEPEDQTDRPAVIVLPGVMGSHLSALDDDGDRDRVWLSVPELALGGIRRLQAGAEGVKAEELVSSAYSDLCAFLRESGHHVMPFPYDWRLSIADAAAALRGWVRRRLDASPGRPIGLIAHSMGGIVARHFIADCEAAGAGEQNEWAEVVTAGGRLVQLGTPNQGSHLIPYLMQGEERLLKILAAVDLKHSKKEWLEFVARFPGLLELAPHVGEHDFYRQQTWEMLDVLVKPQVGHLNEAKKVVQRLGTVDLSEHAVVYVAGKADRTPTIEPGQREIGFTPRGDGRVTWETGIPAGVDTWFIDTKHGDLASHERSFPGILELVTTGDTQKLSREEPVSRAGADIQRLGEEDLEVYPTQESLERAVLGADDREPWEEREDDEPSCAVSVVLGDLTYTRHPVMVGHYAGDPIIHAEEVLDRRLNGTLSERHQLGLYPREVGSHEVVLRKGKGTEKGTDGAVVVGLGTVGELTPGDLAASVEAAVARYLSVSAEEGSQDSAEVGLTSVLIGSGETGLSVEQVVESLLAGVRSANRKLRSTVIDGAVPRRVSEIELVEVYEDRALEALHALHRLEERSLPGFQVKRDLDRSKGGRRRATFGTKGGWWAPLRVEKWCDPARVAAGSTDANGLEFSSQGRRARVDGHQLPVQSELVHQMLSRPLFDQGGNRELRESLFELLLPPGIKESAGDRNNLLLVLDEFAAQYPWEMLADRRSDRQRPLSVQAGIVRKLLVKDPARVSHPEENVALVVGDPPSAAPRLQGAEDEAKHVADFLESTSTWRVVRQIRHDVSSEKAAGKSDIDAQSVCGKLMTGDYRLLHLAGHGIYDPEDPTRSGMIIGDGSKADEFVLISPAEVGNLRLKPELVFINCCHLGRIQETPPHLLASNLAAEFIRSGVKAVVAAGWEVEDRPAAVFAEAFYREMFRESSFGEAVLEARRATWNESRQGNTWAAYQCYGDPGFRLMMDPTVRQRVTEPRGRSYVDPQEIVVDLENLQNRAQQAADSGDEESVRESVESELDVLERTAKARGWIGEASLLVNLARAYGELGNFEPAMSFYESAKAAESGGVTLRDLEQLANFRARHAAARAEEDPEAAEREIRRSLEELDRLLDLAPTRERWSLKGGSIKRYSAFASDGAWSGYVEEMTNAYATAAAMHRDDLYALLNALTGVLLLGGPWPDGRASLETSGLASTAEFGAALTGARERAPLLATERDFWSRTLGPDLAMLTALASDDYAARLDEVVEGYRALFARYGTPREHKSVRSQFGFLARSLRRPVDGGDAQDRDAKAAFVERVQAALG